MCRMIGIGWSADSFISQEDGEHGPQLRSLLDHILNVPQSLAFGFLSPAAALDDRFEHPPPYLVIAR
jgi:hypothetical protein